MRKDDLHQNPKRKRGPAAGGRHAAIVATVLMLLPGLAQANPGPQAALPGTADFQKLLADKGAAIVTVKFVLKVKSSWGDSENEREASGVMIEPDGLVLCSNTMLSGFRGWSRRSGEMATPTDIKVLIGEDSEGLDAKLIARDSELDLTWIRIKDPGDKKFAFVDLKASAVPAIGEWLYSVVRLGRYFDRAPVVRGGRLGGITNKPRLLYIPSHSSGTLGLPVFNASGAVVGISVSQMPDPEEMQGGGSGMHGAAGVILPSAKVFKATQRAKEAAEQEEEDAKQVADTDEDDG